MKNSKCSYCQLENDAHTKFCKENHNFPANRQTEKAIPEIQLYIPTFQTDVFGIMLLDQEQHDEDVFSATRWIYFFIPLFPLTRITFKVNKITTVASQMTLFRLKIFESHLPGLVEVLSVYMRILIGVFPIILAVKFGDFIRRNLGFWITFILFIGAVGWLVLTIIKMQNDKINYKKYAV